ncbi:class I SAM-dependent methyltransferase [Tissierella praeacuta]|uniref:class I SAM-dependent methyltransferase n=1 Tax=Tissierella praeacuta TaxID=43131 RepID=UPI001C122BF0|nr:SAM-dependent methyltransferase [Tissierella praeacuta]MBU5256393.1 SAM-dependent methyltransferase [Tissierella praeacuta]
MNEVVELLNEIILNNKITYGVLSNLRIKDEESFSKVIIKPVLIQKEIRLQFAYEYRNKVLHKNLEPLSSINEIEKLLTHKFKQGMIFTNEADYQLLINKKGGASILKKKPTKKQLDFSHNRKKSYIIEDGEPVDFLIRLGVMNENGKVVSKRYDKFKQINRFLEMVSDVIQRMNKDKTLNIVDFGCGKSYLTFALYYYLVNILGLDVNIIGLDLKQDVIEFCNEVAMDLNYERLKFIHGDIKDYDGFNKVNMVVTLHACDIATDAALVKAINWEAEAILSVPCCQHEFYDKIKNPVLEPMLSHGIIKEKLASLVTDSLRANILEILGYQVQLLEFIDMEHTPKNILIRAMKTNNKNKKESINKYVEFKKFWGLKDLYIEKELGEKIIKKLN